MKIILRPSINKDWDKNRKVVTGINGNRMVLHNDRAKEVYDANLRIYHKRVNLKK